MRGVALVGVQVWIVRVDRDELHARAARTRAAARSSARRTPWPSGSGSTRRSATMASRSAKVEKPWRWPSVPSSPSNDGARRRRPGGSPARATPPRASTGVMPYRGDREPIGELGHEAVVERVGDDEDLVEDVVEGLDVGRPVALDARDRLVLGQLEVQREKVEDLLLGPVRVGAGEERGDLPDVRGPALRRASRTPPGRPSWRRRRGRRRS